MIETEVHQRLRAYLKEQGQAQWPHHLTMARLVARALRVGRSALIQTDSLAAYQGSYRLSYLIPALLWPEPAVLALPDELIDQVIHQDVPNLQQGLPGGKPVRLGDRWPDETFKGLLITSAQGWLQARLCEPEKSAQNLAALQGNRHFPAGIPTLIDGAGELERWAQAQLSETIRAQDWEDLMLAYPSQREFIRDTRVRVTHAIFQHPANPYGCHLIADPEQTLLRELYDWLLTYGDISQLPGRWRRFWQQFSQAERLAWSSLDRDLGSVMLHSGPTEISSSLAPMWAQQPVVLIGAALDEDTRAERYRDRLGLGEMTCLRFGPDRRHDLIQLYLPDHLPMPNTSHFKAAALQEIRMLLGARGLPSDPTVIVIGDMPLKAQFAAVLAAEFGSRVRLEAPVSDQGILITGWEYWRQHQADFTTPSVAPGLLIITTLPIPSLENPLVAGRVAAYKRQRQDWFKAYLLPKALSELQHAVAPVRSRANPLQSRKSRNSHQGNHQGIVALLDNRVNYRSYGANVLAALSPIARSTYLNEDWFQLNAAEAP
ncbi:MAG: ATP-dependent DNA helicase [Phormidesmis sp.]